MDSDWCSMRAFLSCSMWADIVAIAVFWANKIRMMMMWSAAVRKGVQPSWIAWSGSTSGGCDGSGNGGTVCLIHLYTSFYSVIICLFQASDTELSQCSINGRFSDDPVSSGPRVCRIDFWLSIPFSQNWFGIGSVQFPPELVQFGFW